MNIKIFKNYPNLFFEMSERKDGSMRERENVKRFLKKIKVSSIVRADLCHDNKVARVSLKDKGKNIKKTDALTTKEKNLFISITVADCIPVLFYNPKKGEVGVVHAGWKGINLGIIEGLRIDFKETLFYIGPGISKCHFEVSKGFPLPHFKRGNKYFSDLKGIIKERITALGGKTGNIEISKDCTYCKEEKYFSFRRERKVNPMLVIFGIKE